MLKISKIIFYDEPSVPEIDLDRLIEFAKNTVGSNIEKRESILKLGGPQTYADVAASRVLDLDAPYTRHTPSFDDLRSEQKYTKNVTNDPSSTCYDGIQLQNVFGSLIARKELTQDTFHIVFTDKLICTYDAADHRYHGRAVICSNPSIISTTGIIEAPAKPREYYIEMITTSRLGVDTTPLKAKYARACLQYHDKRLSTVVEGYFLQALLYYVSGEPFCESPDCRLYNAHWQKDLLHSQFKTGKLCKKHQLILESMKNLN